MKELTKINEMTVGNTYETDMLLIKATEKTSKKASYPFLELSLSDGETRIVARKFNSDKNELDSLGIKDESVVRLIINVGTYNDSVNYIVSDIWNSSSSRNVKSFIPKAPININKAFNELLTLIELNKSSDDEWFTPIAKLAEKLLWENKEAFTHSAAGKSIHHSVIGGLLQHSLAVATDAARYCDSHPNLDRELLISSAALHDIGKIYELTTSTTGDVEYTIEGRMLGHSAIGISMIDEAVKNDDKEWYDAERVLLLKHMIASHHGSPQYGALVQPAIPEATVLHCLDSMDAKVNTMEAKMKTMEEGKLSERIYGLGNVSIYKTEAA